MMYCKNCDVIQPFLSHCISEIRFDTTKARDEEKLRSASALLHGIVFKSFTNTSTSPNRQLYLSLAPGLN
jgi:hypothetical protein